MSSTRMYLAVPIYKIHFILSLSKKEYISVPFSDLTTLIHKSKHTIHLEIAI